MKRIIIHWTAGAYQPNSTDIEHYHFLIDSNGNVKKGRYSPEDNLSTRDGVYAQHTGGGNTGSIGIAVCGMLGFKNRSNVGNFPLTKIQCEKLFSEVAKLCNKYNLKVTPDTVLTHYEYGKAHPNTSSAGKIDIIYLPPYPHIPTNGVGNFIRNKVRWYLSKE